jgi:hypothetical protein
LREDFAGEMFIWRPILEGLVSLGEVKRGEVDIIDILKLNSLLDLKNALERREIERAKSKK